MLESLMENLECYQNNKTIKVNKKTKDLMTFDKRKMSGTSIKKSILEKELTISDPVISNLLESNHLKSKIINKNKMFKNKRSVELIKGFHSNPKKVESKPAIHPIHTSTVSNLKQYAPAIPQLLQNSLISSVVKDNFKSKYKVLQPKFKRSKSRKKGKPLSNGEEKEAGNPSVVLIGYSSTAVLEEKQNDDRKGQTYEFTNILEKGKTRMKIRRGSKSISVRNDKKKGKDILMVESSRISTPNLIQNKNDEK